MLEELGERWPLAVCLERLGTIAAAWGGWGAAIAAYAAADTLRLFLAAPPTRLARAGRARDLDLARAAIATVPFDTAWLEVRELAALQALARYRALILAD